MTSTEMEKFVNAGFSRDQIEEINEGLQKRVNVSIYANKEFMSMQMRQIRLGLEEHLPVEIYAKQEFDWFQMEEIRNGLKSGVDVSTYANKEISYEHMREIRKGLEKGINLTAYLKLKAGVIRQLRKAVVTGINITKYINEGYDAEQLAEIREALENGIDLDPYLSKEYRGASIAEIRKGLQNRVDVSLYAMVYYNWRQMREIRLGLENRIDVSKYSSKLYSWEQMREVRLGLEQGFDVENYRLLRYTASEMRKKRLAIVNDIHLVSEATQAIQVKSADFMFEFSTDEMEAYIIVLTEGKTITRARLIEILKENGIHKGYQEDAIERIVSGKYGRKGILIAKGEESSKGEDGWYEFFFRTNIDRKPKQKEDGSVDFQNIDWFEMVQEGQKIAFYHEAKDGLDGYNVKGVPIKARKGTEQRILTGKGFKMAEDKKTYYAAMDGMISLDNNEIQITQHMILDEVNMATGNVTFGGSIYIRGDVGNGTVVKAASDVLVDGNVEAAIIESGGSIILKKGMNSAGHGQITAEKDIVSRFFESAKVVAKGNIEVDKCLNSQLYAGGKIKSSKIIAGGVAHAEQGFQLNNVGNQAGLHTVLKLKANDKTAEENKRVKAAIRDVKHELEMLNNSYEEFKAKFPPEVRNNMDMFAKVEKAVFTKNKQLEQLMKLKADLEKIMQKAGEATVVISGQAFEGTVLEMDDGRWYADNQYNIVVKRQDDQMEVYNN